MKLTLNILVVFIVIHIACILFNDKLKNRVFKDYVIGRLIYHKRKEKQEWSLKRLWKWMLDKEVIVLFLSLLFALLVLLWNYCHWFQKAAPLVFKAISDFTTNYPLITTIVGAFIALWCIYLLVHVKAYVCPIVLYSPITANGGDKYFIWYIENRSLFDAVNIDASVYKCSLIGEQSVRYDELKMTCDHVGNMTGRWFDGNRICLKLKKQQLKRQDVIDKSFLFLEISASFVHALSNVITVMPVRYNVYDIYYAKVVKGKVFTDRAPLPDIELNTMRVRMQKCFMCARKYVTYLIVFVLTLFLLESMGLYKTEFLNDMGHWLQEGIAYTIILFACIRYAMQLQVNTTIADFHYRPYRVCNKI